MLFNSFEFLLFFPIVTIGYFVLPHRVRWAWLLIASCLFYMAFRWYYILILGFTIAVDYVAGLLIEKAEGRRRKWLLALSLIANIGVLAIFKYPRFIADTTFGVSGLDVFGPGSTFHYFLDTIILPIGLSFHTFQSMAYTIEVYKGKQAAERHPGIFAVYVMFYPQLVAGPIERPQHLLPQFREKHNFDYNLATEGLKLMAWGFFMKIAIADRLSPAVNAVFGGPLAIDLVGPQGKPGPTLAIAAVLYAFQIYCDFAGYSLIAIGSAKVMGFRLMDNFRRPYFSKGIGEFWSRWHISLSSWFRDYMYIPMGGNRVSRPRWLFNIFSVFLVSGLWHGANWTFVIWGALHGAYRVVEILSEGARGRALKATRLERRKTFLKFASVLITFGLVAFAWIFFRARNLQEAVYIVTHLTAGWDLLLSPIGRGLVFDPLGGYLELAIMFGLIGLLLVVELIQRRGSIIEWVARQPAPVRWGIYYAAMLSLVVLGRMGVGEGNNEFIYFQF